MKYDVMKYDVKKYKPNIGPNIGSPIGPNIEHNIGPNIELNIEPNIGLNIGPNIEHNIGPNIGQKIKHNIGPNIDHNIGPNIGPNIEHNIEHNIRSDIGPNIGPNIEPNIEPSLTTLPTNSLKRRSEFIAVADVVEGMAISGGDRQPSRAATALKGSDSPQGDRHPSTMGPIEVYLGEEQIVEVIEVDQLGGTKRRDSPYI